MNKINYIEIQLTHRVPYNYRTEFHMIVAMRPKKPSFSGPIFQLTHRVPYKTAKSVVFEQSLTLFTSF